MASKYCNVVKELYIITRYAVYHSARGALMSVGHTHGALLCMIPLVVAEVALGHAHHPCLFWRLPAVLQCAAHLCWDVMYNICVGCMMLSSMACVAGSREEDDEDTSRSKPGILHDCCLCTTHQEHDRASQYAFGIRPLAMSRQLKPRDDCHRSASAHFRYCGGNPANVCPEAAPKADRGHTEAD